MATTNLNNYKVQQSEGEWLNADVFTMVQNLRFKKDEVDKIYALYVEYCELRGIEYNVKGNTLYSFVDAMIKMFLCEHIEANAQLLIDIEKQNIDF